MDLDKLYKFQGIPLSKLRQQRIDGALKDDNRVMNFIGYRDVYFKSLVERFGEGFDWAKLTIKEKVFHGWMRPILIMTDTMINNRWNYWLDIRASHEVEGKSIPQLDFLHSSDDKFKFVSTMIKRCLDSPKKYMYGGSRIFYLFVDWLLYSFGSPMVTALPSEIDDELNTYWYENFILDMMLMYPADYFVITASEIYDSKAFNAGAFYPTPSHIVQFMVEISYLDHDDPKMKEKYKYAKVCEPCMGSGIMLLYQSNYSLMLYGQDIDLLMCKIATLNGYLYMPWLIESDDETNKLLDEMHDKYWNTDEDKELLESIRNSMIQLQNASTDFNFDNLDLEE